ncbi:hypothetical protein GPJ56_004545 [Histomonas meleagridis]|uniref:uncharacterized protein n=1 Tax=Histomonas meleagridis TaxID=135588 RepID=UPI003559AB6B|nr:hypothetical protein GPJ56_004545 [Histomonas meleagridis]KAH0797364.1 hypothetical protein GO595_009867 [Histomonas meleagridis]
MTEENKFSWEQVIPANTTVPLKCENDMVLTITSAKLSNIDNSKLDQESTVIAKIKTVLLSDSDDEGKVNQEDQVDFPFKESSIEICLLKPKSKEQQETEVTFSPIDVVELVNSGFHEVLLSGYTIKLDEIEEEEEEESSSEEIPPEEIQNRYKAMAAKQGPRAEKKRE